MKYELKEPDCGIGCCKPQVLRPFAGIKWFTAVYSCAAIVVSSLSMFIVSQITTIERQFGLNSGQTGFLMACNDIGYAAVILIASHFSSRVHIPRFLCLSTIFYGISGFVCAIPHFIYKYETPASGGSLMQRNTTLKSQSKLCANMTSIFHSRTNLTDKGLASLNEEQQSFEEVRTTAMAFIAVGMILQGFGKAPRFPMLTQYLDDNTKKRETGFYMGIITGLSIFGPAVAYGLGGVFSQIYVTLEDVDLHPRDPRWLGAWWLGFLVFGIGAIFFGIPLIFFPKSLVPKAVKRNQKSARKKKLTCGAIYREFKEFLKSIVRILRDPLYSVTLVASLANILGLSSTVGFTPKYMEKQFNITAWKANIIMAVTGLISVCIGSFFGGWLTKKIKLDPPRALILIFSTCVISLILTLVTMFLSCEPPVILNWDPKPTSFVEISASPSCMSQCSCRSDQFLPICGSDGMNYFSPCHAGCSEGNITVFRSCSCIPGGVATSGLCESDCPLFWPWNVLNFISALIGSTIMMPTFIFFIRIVPEEIKSMAVGIAALGISLFGWLPGPVLGGKLVDAACILWSSTGSCNFYDNDSMRYNMYGINIACRALAVLLFAVVVVKSWNMSTWSGNARDESPDLSEDVDVKRRPEADALMGKFTFHSKR